ncbi:MAG TPA: hypothetical protein VF077_00400 [Nitrospiraceae bacterium]
MGKSAGTNKTVSSTAPASFQQPYINSLLSESQKLYNSEGPSYFPGNTVADFNDKINTGQGYLSETAGQNAAKNDTQIDPATQFGLKAYDVANNPYVTGMAKASTEPIIQQLKEEVLPGLRSGAIATGTQGSSRQGISEAQGMERAARAAMNTQSGIYGQAYGQGLTTMSNTLSQMPALQSMSYQPGQVMTGIGEQQRGLEQAKIDAEIAKHNYNQQLPYQKLVEYGNQVSKPFGGTSTSDVTATGGANQTIGGILSGAGSILEILKTLGYLK